MIIFLCGQDTYRSKAKLNEIIESYKKIHKSGLSLSYLDCKELDFEEIKNEVNTVSMFKEKKLLVFKNSFENVNNQEKVLGLMKLLKNREDIVVVYEEKEPKKSFSLFRFLEKHAKRQNFEPLEKEELKNWIKKEFAEYDIKIDTTTLNKLIEFVGNDTWQLNNEIKKLVNFKSNKRITPEDVELLVKAKIEADIFKTIDAIAQKDRKKALFLIHKHLEKGDNPLYLFSMINFQFRNLLIIKDLVEKNKPYYTILKVSKLHPFVVKKSLEQVRKFSFQELKKIYQKIFQVDLSIKTGKLEPKTALDLFIAEI